MKYCLLIFAILQFGFTIKASNDLYIQVKENNTVIAFGHYPENKPKAIEQSQVKLTDLNRKRLSQNLPIDPNKETLIFIHAMWGNGKGSQKGNLKYFRQLCGPDYQIINIVWKAGHLNYKKNWNRAIQTGQVLVPVFEYLTNQQSQGHHIFCHSMGNRVFEGMLSTAKTDFWIENVILMASDLDTNVFEHNLKCLQNKVQHINVYLHKKDRALKISKRRHKRNRLGLDGTALGEQWKGKIKLIDATNTKTKRGGLSKHLYFRKDEKVKLDLRSIFSKNADVHRHRRALKILDEKKYLYAL